MEDKAGDVEPGKKTPGVAARWKSQTDRHRRRCGVIEERRFFLRGLAGASGCLLLMQEQAPTPIKSRHKSLPDPPEAGGPLVPGTNAADPRAGRRAQLQQQGKE